MGTGCAPAATVATEMIRAGNVAGATGARRAGIVARSSLASIRQQRSTEGD